ncbi:hypothetical protein [Streptomyces orinoci]|uniref:Secreted protein n=1 Tax=Streptomyces orinoci TaxID=67339 RepID=A0ABV3K098_STRON|nr:hypothetical protein [Streptomyces orinoci]
MKRRLITAALGAAVLSAATYGTASAATASPHTAHSRSATASVTVIGDYISAFGCESNGMWGQFLGEWSSYKCVAVHEPNDDRPWYRLIVW